MAGADSPIATWAEGVIGAFGDELSRTAVGLQHEVLVSLCIKA
jgi:hypothetical protein